MFASTPPRVQIPTAGEPVQHASLGPLQPTHTGGGPVLSPGLRLSPQDARQDMQHILQLQELQQSQSMQLDASRSDAARLEALLRAATHDSEATIARLALAEADGARLAELLEATTRALAETSAKLEESEAERQASEEQLRASSVEGLPIEVLVAPRYEPRLDEVRNAEVAAAWQAAYESLSPGLVRQTTAWGAGHIIQIDRPDLVIEATRRLIDLARGR